MSSRINEFIQSYTTQLYFMSRTTIEVHDSLGDYMMNRVSSECDLLTRSRLAVTRVRINGGSRGDIAVASDVCWIKVRDRLEGISNPR